MTNFQKSVFDVSNKNYEDKIWEVLCLRESRFCLRISSSHELYSEDPDGLNTHPNRFEQHIYHCGDTTVGFTIRRDEKYNRRTQGRIYVFVVSRNQSEMTGLATDLGRVVDSLNKGFSPIMFSSILDRG